MSFKQTIIDGLRRYIPVERFSGHTLVTRHLNKNTTVLDLGANLGNFSTLVKEQLGCQIFCVEANRDLIPDLERKGFKTLHAAAAGKSRKIQFNVMENNETSSVFEISSDNQGANTVAGAHQQTVSVDGLSYGDILEKFSLDSCDLLKIDIEGAEIEFLDAMTDEQLRNIAQIAVEFHSFMNYYEPEVSRRVIERIKRAGFYDLRPYRRRDVDVLLINKKRCPGAWWDQLKVMFFVRPLLSIFWNLFRVLQGMEVAKSLAG